MARGRFVNNLLVDGKLRATGTTWAERRTPSWPRHFGADSDRLAA